MLKFLSLLKLVLFLYFPAFVFAQTVVDNLNATYDENASVTLIDESIKNIAPSKRIFILTNNNNGYFKGDFISLVLNDELVARAIVAKTQEGFSGVKILKIYSLKHWNMLKVGTPVKIIRGDDSQFAKSKKESNEEKPKDLIASEEDLFNETTLEGSLDEEENKNRAIKTDNIVSVFFGQYRALDVTGSKKDYPHYGASWAFQFYDNFWGEASYGHSTLAAFPAADINTTLTTITMRGKYTFTGPLESFIQPYLGYQVVSVDSPEAGVEGANSTDEELDAEIAAVNQLKKNKFIFGVSLLKRLVPGWFVNASLGNDMVFLGAALEF